MCRTCATYLFSCGNHQIERHRINQSFRTFFFRTTNACACVCVCARAFILEKIKFQPEKKIRPTILFSSSASKLFEHLSTFHFNRENWFGIQTSNVNLVPRSKQPKILLIERRAVVIGNRCYCFEIALQDVTYNSESRWVLGHCNRLIIRIPVGSMKKRRRKWRAKSR